MRRKIEANGETINVDFSDDEIERRANELILRMCGKPATFDLATGQPVSGPPLPTDELKRRGY